MLLPKHLVLHQGSANPTLRMRGHSSMLHLSLDLAVQSATRLKSSSSDTASSSMNRHSSSSPLSSICSSRVGSISRLDSHSPSSMPRNKLGRNLQRSSILVGNKVLATVSRRHPHSLVQPTHSLVQPTHSSQHGMG